jgi:S-adenosyl methyltransferase
VTEKKWYDSVVPEDAASLRDLDTTVAHPARVYNYWLGGKDYFEADKKAAEQAIDAYPAIIRGVRAQRAFLASAVRFLAGEAGIRQFLDIGTGIPAASNTHEVAQSVAPQCLVVYADNDPMVLAHARALLTSDTGRTAYLDADLRDTGTILGEAARLLDFSRPTAIMLIGILHLIPDEDDPYAIVARLVDAMPSGSWLAIAHPAREIEPDQVAEMTRRYNERVSTAATLRTHAEISRFFDGMELLEPGVVQLHRWRPAAAAADSDEDVAAYCGLAHKP